MVRVLTAAALIWWGASQAQAQMVTTTGSLQGLGSTYSEGFQVGGAFGGPNWFLRWGSATMPQPAMVPDGGVQGGVGFGGVGGIGFGAWQSATSSSVSSAASVTTLNGHSGSMFHGTVVPFVVGVVPVVGQQVIAPGSSYHLPWMQQLAEQETAPTGVAVPPPAREAAHIPPQRAPRQRTQPDLILRADDTQP